MVCDMIGLRFLQPYDWLRAFETFSKLMDFFKKSCKKSMVQSLSFYFSWKPYLWVKTSFLRFFLWYNCLSKGPHTQINHLLAFFVTKGNYQLVKAPYIPSLYLLVISSTKRKLFDPWLVLIWFSSSNFEKRSEREREMWNIPHTNPLKLCHIKHWLWISIQCANILATSCCVFPKSGTFTTKKH
jgi:hypothetical protein